jgi:prepilin-type N-terminal cleavage/methylation domain-containing protein
MIRPAGARSGFTLLEVVVTVFLVSIVLTLGFSSLFFSARFSTDQRLRQYKEREFARIYAQMRRQFLCIYASDSVEESLEGIKGMEERKDEIRFLTASPVFGGGVVEAEYFVVAREDGSHYLAYSEFPYAGKMDFEGGREVEISGIIDGLKVEYGSGEQVFEQWKDKEAPEKIIVTLYSQKDEFRFTAVPGIKAGFW